MAGPFTEDAFDARRMGLEAEYFRSQDEVLVSKLKSVFNSKVSKDELSAATGITNDEALERLINANVKGELLTAFRLYPLVEIAWADGSVDKKESEAVVKAALQSGVPAEGPAMDRLREWIGRGPTDNARAAWKYYAEELKKKLTPDELKRFRTDLLKYAHAVAESSGGVFNVLYRTSPSEQRVIDEITKRLS